MKIIFFTLYLSSLLNLLLSFRLKNNNPSFSTQRKSLIQPKTYKILRLRTTILRMNTETTPPGLTLKLKLTADMKDAMKNKQKNRLSAIRSIQTAIKQKEVDDRIEVDDEAAIAIMSKIVKQRKESIKSYADAGRKDLADNEQEELDVITSYLPKPFSAEDIEKAINEAIVRLAAVTVKDMGKVINDLRPKLAGKADIAEVGNIIKKKLGGK